MKKYLMILIAFSIATILYANIVQNVTTITNTSGEAANAQEKNSASLQNVATTQTTVVTTVQQPQVIMSETLYQSPGYYMYGPVYGPTAVIVPVRPVPIVPPPRPFVPPKPAPGPHSVGPSPSPMPRSMIPTTMPRPASPAFIPEGGGGFKR